MLDIVTFSTIYRTKLDREKWKIYYNEKQLQWWGRHWSVFRPAWSWIERLFAPWSIWAVHGRPVFKPAFAGTIEGNCEIKL